MNTTGENQFDWYLAALNGVRGELTRGDPKSGYYTDKGRVIAVYRDSGKLFWEVSSGYDPKDEVELDDQFGFFCSYPIPYDIWEAVAQKGQVLPPECLVRLTLKEIQAGEAWTIEKARAKLARQNGLHAPGAVHGPTRAERAAAAAIVEPDAAENPRAVMGGNEPPEPMAPDLDLAARLTAMEAQAAEWLASIGGKPRDQIECDKAANYRQKFLELEQEAEAKRVAEKDIHKRAGEAVDAKWKPHRDGAELLKKQMLAIANAWMKAEKDRLAEITRLENERLAAEAKAENDRRDALRASLAASPSAPAVMPDLAPVTFKPVEAPKVTAGTIGRAVGVQSAPAVYRIDDIGKVAAYLAGLSLESSAYRTFFDGCQKSVNALGKLGLKIPGVNEAAKTEQAA